MATNAELQAAIAELSDVDTAGMTNAVMVALLADLKQEAEAEAGAAAKAEATGDTLIVAAGKSITSKVGIVAHPRVVTAKMLTGGQDALDALVAAGVCVKGSAE